MAKIDTLTGLPLPSGGGSSSGGKTTIYRCESVDESAKTWTGHKAVFAEGSYSFEDSVTRGLTFGTAYTPVVGSIYDGDATFLVKQLYTDYNVPPGAILCNCESLTDPVLSFTNCEISTTVKKYGSGSAKINNNGHIEFETNKDLLEVPWTAAMFFYADNYEGGSGNATLLNNDDDSAGAFCIQITPDGYLRWHVRAGGDGTIQKLNAGWHHLRVVHPGGSILRIYLDGVFIKEVTTFDCSVSMLWIGRFGFMANQFLGYIDGIEFFEIPSDMLTDYTGETAPVPSKEFIIA